MSTWERATAEALFDGAIRLTLVVFVADIATRRLIRHAPADAHRVWRFVAAGALLMPFLTAAVPPSVFIQPSASVLGSISDSGESLTRYVVWIAALGTAFGACRLLVGLASMCALVRRGTVLSRPRRARSRPVFLESDRIAVPVTFGLLRRYIALPVTWRNWDRARLRAVVGHELAHVRRADYAAGLAAAVLRSIWWWHPAAWIIGARLSLTAELACDARASVRIGPTAYAQALLAVIAESGGRRLRYGWLAGAGSRLSARIDALLASDRPQEKRGAGGFALTVVIVVLTATCAAASVRFTPRTQLVPAVTMDHDAMHSARHGH